MHEKNRFQSKNREKEALHYEHSEVYHLLTSPNTKPIPWLNKKKENKKARVSIYNKMLLTMNMQNIHIASSLQIENVFGVQVMIST